MGVPFSRIVGRIGHLGGIDGAHDGRCRGVIGRNLGTQEVGNCNGGDNQYEWDRGKTNVAHDQARQSHSITFEPPHALANVLARHVPQNDGWYPG